MNIFRGGAKLKNKEKQGFQPVLDMLNSDGSRIELLTYTSLSGTMFTLSVTPGNSEYVDFNLSSKKFDTPIYNFILKIVIIKNGGDRQLTPYNDINNKLHKKLSETT
jgi:hypothetical protein